MHPELVGDLLNGEATVLQGGVADIIKTAVVSVEQAITAAGFATRMVALIDDLMVFEVAPGERDDVEDHVRDQMACAYPLDLPLRIVGPRWSTSSRRKTSIADSTKTEALATSFVRPRI